MPENAIIPDGEAVPETAKEKFERERLSHRQALKRLGMTSAMATFALFSVDDLARMVGKAMQQQAGDNRVAMQVAKELQQAGVAMAGTSPLPYGNCNMFQNSGTQNDCWNCNEDRRSRCLQSCPDYQCNGAANCGYHVCGSSPATYAALQQCWATACQACLANCN